MPRKFPGTWEGPPHNRWVKMIHGKRLRVACSTLAAMYGDLPETEWTKEGSYQHAARWFAEQLGQTPPERDPAATMMRERIEWAKKHDPDITAELERLNKIESSDDQDSAKYRMDFLRDLGVEFPDDLDPVVVEEIFGEKEIWRERLNRETKVAKVDTVSAAIDGFLEHLRISGMKAKTYNEILDMMDTIKEWWGTAAVKSIDEAKVLEAWKRVAGMDVVQNTKAKRWGFFKRWMHYLDAMGILDLPRNLRNKNKMFGFRQQVKAVKTYPVDLVRTALLKLPEKLRCWALLGLNCGMTNIDIGQLRPDMVSADGYLTRKRVKTEAIEDVPTVTYKLWPETVALLTKFKSEIADLWFVSSSGTPLVSNRMVDGEPKLDDRIGYAWKHTDCPISISKFRNVAANLLESHEVHERFADHFLGHTPASMKHRHYAAPSQELFDKALTWLHDKVF